MRKVLVTSRSFGKISNQAEKMLAEPQDERTRAFLRIFGM